MRIAVLAAVATAVLAFGGTANAETISYILTGTITGGEDGGLNGADDTQGLFGGENLTGATVTLSLSYDTDLLQLAAINDTNGSTYFENPGTNEFYQDYASDGAITESVTINGQTYALSNDEKSPLLTGTLESCNISSCNSSQLYSGVNANNNDPSLGLTLSSSTDIPTGDLGDPAAIQAFMATISGGFIQILSTPSLQADNLTLDDISASATPEPTAWSLTALAIVSAAVLRRRKASGKR